MEHDSKTVFENKLNQEQPEFFYLADGSVTKLNFSAFSRMAQQDLFL